MRKFARIERLPPYVFNITNELKMVARRAGEDVIDMSMGNPDGPTPAHIVAKLVEAAQRAIRELIPKPKMLVIGFPSNPTARCVELDFFERVIALAKAHDILVVHDLAYADITFDGWKAPSIMQVPGARDIAVEFFTMSKSYNMAGWRIGFMVGNKDLVNALARIKSYHHSRTFTTTQAATLVAAES